jgi:hypothetical protein
VPSAAQTEDRAEARLAGLTELYNVLTDAAARLGVLTAVLGFARDADLSHHLLPVIQVLSHPSPNSFLELKTRALKSHGIRTRSTLDAGPLPCSGPCNPNPLNRASL